MQYRMLFAVSLLLLIGNSFAADRQNAILEKELIFNPQEFLNIRPGINNMCHAATIAEAKNKTLVCIFYGGSEEGESDQQLWICY
ncbi:MAG: hypothetical protein GF350_09405 [Chitinivibrionales bacterium]|nr:hypothetical protein [Chitinivibrionales bacterium]